MSDGAKVGLLSVLLVIVFVAVVWDRGAETDPAASSRKEITLPDPPEAPRLARSEPAGASPSGPAPVIRHGLEISADVGPAITLARAAIAAPDGSAFPADPTPAAARDGAETRDLGPDPRTFEEIARAFRPRPVPRPDDAASSAETASGPPTPVPPAPAPGGSREHVVVRGETLSTIAAKVYGNGNLWTRLRDANAARLSDPDKLRPGTRILVPDGPVRRVSPGSKEAHPAKAAPTAHPTTPPAAPRVHVVKKGETLYGIARATLGDGKQWKAILEANRGVVPDPKNLVEGARLVIPPDGGRR